MKIKIYGTPTRVNFEKMIEGATNSPATPEEERDATAFAAELEAMIAAGDVKVYPPLVIPLPPGVVVESVPGDGKCPWCGGSKTKLADRDGAGPPPGHREDCVAAKVMGWETTR